MKTTTEKLSKDIPLFDTFRNEQIKELRIKSKLTQQEFSQKAGINISENNNIKVTDRTLNKILNAFPGSSNLFTLQKEVDETDGVVLNAEEKMDKPVGIIEAEDNRDTNNTNEIIEVKETEVKPENNVIYLNASNPSILRKNIQNYMQFLDLMYIKFKSKIENEIKDECNEEDLIAIINAINKAIDTFNKSCK